MQYSILVCDKVAQSFQLCISIIDIGVLKMSLWNSRNSIPKTQEEARTRDNVDTVCLQCMHGIIDGELCFHNTIA